MVYYIMYNYILGAECLIEVNIDEKRDGKTVLEIIKKELRISSKMLTLLKKREDGITVDGKHVTVRHILRAGENLRISAEDRDGNENLVPSDIPLDIIFEDEDVIVVNKPPMMPTHPSHGHFDDTLANAICYHMRESNTPFVFRSINRLDRNTSGLVLVAKNRIAASALHTAMKQKKIEKKYIALLCGEILQRDGKIETYIRRREKSVIEREVCGPLDDASEAITLYKKLDSDESVTAVLASPITGRTHQLRVHFAHIGSPILGDDLYGKESREISRHALHAVALSFPHPSTGNILTLKAPIPDDMETVMKKHDLKIEV